jgi:peptide/nickel transport system substrate-binding protein
VVREATQSAPLAIRHDEPRRGGTLTLVGTGDVDHLDPALAYHTVTRGIVRAYTRQLVTYTASRNRKAAGVIVPDMAVEVPTRHNGGISHDGREYRFTIKEGVKWNAPSGTRAVTAADVARGIKRLVHPVAPSPAVSYYLSTIEGMTEFRDGLMSVPRTVDDLARYIETHTIPGIRVVNDFTLSFTTRYPTPDFLNMLALSFAAPAPREYLRYMPGSAEISQHIISNGPYRLVRYVPGTEIILERNPAWEPKTDDVRRAYVDRIHVRQGVSEEQAYHLVASGEAEMLWDMQPLTEELPDLLRSNDPRLEVCPAGLLSPYLVFNFLSPNSDHATRKRQFRMAMEYAVDKTAVSRVWGGPLLNDIAHQILPPLCSAHRELCLYPTDGGRGDPNRARKLLAEAGYPHGLTLKMIYRNQDIHPETAREIQTSVRRAGVNLELVPVSINELFSSYFGSPSMARQGMWDLALTGWEPDWYGNNARTYLQPLFDSSNVSENKDWGSNFGYYRNARTNKLIHSALTTPDELQANGFFREAEAQVMRDAAVVPILFAHQYWFHSPRVRNWLPYPVLNGDLTNLWLSPERPD